MHSTFALQSIPPIQSTPSILHSTNSAVWYLHTVSFNHYNLLYTTILFYSCVLFHLHSLVSHKQLPSCLHSSIKEHSFLTMRSIPSIQSFPHKNSHFLVYTQLHTRILFCPCILFHLYSIVSHKQLPSCYILLHKNILFYPCVLFPLFSLFHTKTVIF